MRERNFSAEQIVTVLRQIEVLIGQGLAAELLSLAQKLRRS